MTQVLNGDGLTNIYLMTLSIFCKLNWLFLGCGKEMNLDSSVTLA